MNLTPAERYLELMKRCLMNLIYDDDTDLLRCEQMIDSNNGKIIPKPGHQTLANPESKFIGNIWPSRAHTMIGMPRLNNLQYCVEQVIKQNVPGDLIETGVWRGGAAIFMRAVLAAYDITNRTVWAADSFQGLPKADAQLHPYDAKMRLELCQTLAVSLEEVQTNFKRYDLLDNQVQFLKGWFCDTLPTAPIKQLAVLRLDGDHYESTMDALNCLYPKLSPGGFLIIDDYNVVEGCNRAIHDYRQQHQITEPLTVIAPGIGAWWQRNK